MKLKIKKTIFMIVIIVFAILISKITYGFSVGELTGTPISNSDINNLGNTIITVISTVGSIVSVVVLVVIGLKYMTGSIEEKAKYKSSLMPYFIGAVLVFSASIIAGIVYNIVINLKSS